MDLLEYAAPPKDQIYAGIGVRTFINAAGTYTKLGGSRMPPAVVEAMAQASRHFVEIDELQAKVGARIAAITHNEADGGAGGTSGLGEGGGVYDLGALSFDAPTVIAHNHASTGNDDIFP